MALFPRFRARAFRIIFGSTGAFLGAILFSVALPVITFSALKLLGSSQFEWLAAIAWIMGLLGGGVVGMLSGVALARLLSARIGKRSSPTGEINV
jgi:hypothetical protein